MSVAELLVSLSYNSMNETSTAKAEKQLSAAFNID